MIGSTTVRLRTEYTDARHGRDWTWILDLLTQQSRRANRILSAYFIAHCQSADAEMLDLKMLNLDSGPNISVQPNDLPESVSESVFRGGLAQIRTICFRVYRRMGYKGQAPRPPNRMGKDVIAIRPREACKKPVYVKCQIDRPTR